MTIRTSNMRNMVAKELKDIVAILKYRSQYKRRYSREECGVWPGINNLVSIIAIDLNRVCRDLSDVTQNKTWFDHFHIQLSLHCIDILK